MIPIASLCIFWQRRSTSRSPDLMRSEYIIHRISGGSLKKRQLDLNTGPEEGHSFLCAAGFFQPPRSTLFLAFLVGEGVIVCLWDRYCRFPVRRDVVHEQEQRDFPGGDCLSVGWYLEMRKSINPATDYGHAVTQSVPVGRSRLQHRTRKRWGVNGMKPANEFSYQ